jgi:7-cyano-7-deazaguanine synthase
MPDNKTAVVLFSGGLDSTVCLYWALSKGYNCLALNINYGQRHSREARSARAVCKKLGVGLTEIKLTLPWLEAATTLVGKKHKIPARGLEKIKNGAIPSTYVPGRNLVFMSLAASLADSCGASAIVAGPNAVDYSGYPDCRGQFYKPLAKAIKEGTRAGARGRAIKVLTPLIKMSKAQIAKLGLKLGVQFNMTWSCYEGGKKPCGVCDACKLRAEGFRKAGLEDK